MIKFIFKVVITLMISKAVMATTFIPTSLENLVDESTAIAEVILASKESMQSDLGIIQTQYSFEVLESLGLEVEIAQSKYIQVTMIGGSFNGLTSYIDGAPDFTIGEKSFLLLKRIEGRLYLSNFSMGKYLIKDQNGKKYYESTVFPNDKEIGQVEKQKMFDLFKAVKTSLHHSPTSIMKSPLIPLESSVISFANRDSIVRSPATEKVDNYSLISFFVFGWMLVMAYVFYPKKKR